MRPPRRSRARRLFAASVLVLVASALWPLPPHAGAGRLATAGWWWRAQTGQGASLPDPPHVPEGGLAVGNGADGPTAISAVRFELDSDEVATLLTLVLAESLAPDGAALTACPAASGWFGTQAGPWAERPEVSCGPRAVAGALSADSASWVFPVERLRAEGRLDVVILPAEDAAPFELSFEPPTDTSLQTAPAGSSDSDVDSGPAPPGGSTPPDFGSGDGFGSGPEAPLDFPAVPSATVPPANGPAADDSLRPVPRFGIAAPASSSSDGAADPRRLALVVLIAGLVGAALLWREPPLTPRLLGPMAARRGAAERGPAEAAPAGPDELAGLGRFRRARTGSPPTLH